MVVGWCRTPVLSFIRVALLAVSRPAGRSWFGGGSMILYEIRTALCDYNVKRSLNTGITPLILPCRRGDGVARPETSVDRSFGLCYPPARLGLELGKIAVAIVIARTLDNLKIIRA